MKKITLWLLLILFCKVSQAGDLLIIFDDLGYRKTDLQILALPTKVNVAIIPSAPYATDRAIKAYQQNRHTLIHMPMEAISFPKLEKEAIKKGMNLQQIEARLDYARKRVPFAIALNNHLGSKATSDHQTMDSFMSILAKDPLIFIDSMTSGNSVAYQTALKYKLKALKRNIFLDNEISLSAIQHQWNLAIQRAKTHQTTIIIGHPHLETINVVKMGINNLPKNVNLINFDKFNYKEDKLEVESEPKTEQDNLINILNQYRPYLLNIFLPEIIPFIPINFLIYFSLISDMDKNLEIIK